MQKKLVEKAEKVIKEWEAIKESRRSYEHESWHCVNVKRYHDAIDEDDLLKIAKEVHPDDQDMQKILVRCGKSLLKGDSIYYIWLDQEWEQLNYEVSDIVELGMREKPFSHIKTEYRWAKGKSILSLGRSGGWACFQTQNDDVEEDLLNTIDEYKRLDGTDPEYKKQLEKDIQDRTEEIEEIMQEVADVKALIKKFNDGLDFKDEVKFRLEEIDTKEIDFKAIQAFDTGPDGTVDRYTIIYKDGAYGMAEDPGTFNQYIGDPEKLHIPSLGKKLKFADLPEEVRLAVLDRLID